MHTLPLNIFATSIVGPAGASIASPPIPQSNLVSPRSTITLAISRDMTFFCSSVKSSQTRLSFWPSINSCAMKAGPALCLPSSQAYTFGAGICGTCFFRKCKQATSCRVWWGWSEGTSLEMRSMNLLSWEPPWDRS